MFDIFKIRFFCHICPATWGFYPSLILPPIDLALKNSKITNNFPVKLIVIILIKLDYVFKVSVLRIVGAMHKKQKQY